MSTSTDLMYNADSRYLHVMYKIYFSSINILEVTKANYLVSSSGLEESYKASDSPFGDVTSNEISFTIFNDNGIFNPSNTSSPYYGLIKKGIKVEAFIRPNEVTEWDPLGVYYVTEWYTNSSGMTADVTANDSLYNVINGSVPPMPVYRNIPFVDFADEYFSYFGLSAIIDESLKSEIIPFIYTSEHSNNKAFLTDLMEGLLADCFCDHDGNIRILSKVSKRTVRATITDNDQIISVMVKQSITTNYDSVVVTYNKCQESIEQSLVELAALALTPGINSTGKLIMSKHPVLSIKSLKTVGSSSAKVTSFSATAKDFTGSVQSTDTTSVSLDVIGTVLDTVSITVGDSGDAPLSIESEFIQDEVRANAVLDYAKDYVDANMPILEVTVRGNPKLQLGDMIRVSSSKYKTDYIGIINKISYEYSGSLSSKITLIDASDLEEV